jgi:hypothetical protein
VVVGPRPERRRLVDTAQEVAEAAGGLRGLDGAAVAVLLQLEGGGGVQELVHTHAGGATMSAADGRVERDQAAAGGVVRRRMVHGALGRRRARDVEVDLGAVLAPVAAGRLRLLVQVDQLRRPPCCLPALQCQYLHQKRSINRWLLVYISVKMFWPAQPKCSVDMPSIRREDDRLISDRYWHSGTEMRDAGRDRNGHHEAIDCASTSSIFLAQHSTQLCLHILLLTFRKILSLSAFGLCSCSSSKIPQRQAGPGGVASTFRRADNEAKAGEKGGSAQGREDDASNNLFSGCCVH